MYLLTIFIRWFKIRCKNLSNLISKYNIKIRYRCLIMTLERKFFLGFIRIHILYHADKEEIYGTEMINELRRHGYEVSPGTIYPILHSLENEGCLTSKEKNVEGKIRKYYKITEEGLKILKEARKKIKELINEVME